MKTTTKKFINSKSFSRDESNSSSSFKKENSFKSNVRNFQPLKPFLNYVQRNFISRNSKKENSESENDKKIDGIPFPLQIGQSSHPSFSAKLHEKTQKKLCIDISKKDVDNLKFYIEKKFNSEFHSKYRDTILKCIENDVKYTSASHFQTAAILDLVYNIYQEESISIGPQYPIPEDLDEVLRHASMYSFKLLNEAVSSKDSKYGFQELEAKNNSLYKYLTQNIKFGGENINFNAQETLYKLYKCFNNSYFENISPENRWKMCIDPQSIEILQSLSLNIDNNPLLGFLFDDDRLYLSGMAKGWESLIRNLEEPVSVDFILNLWKAYMPPERKDLNNNFYETGGVSFGLLPGYNLSNDGRKELIEFSKKLREDIPYYSLNDEQADFARSIKIFFKKTENNSNKIFNFKINKLSKKIFKNRALEIEEENFDHEILKLIKQSLKKNIPKKKIIKTCLDSIQIPETAYLKIFRDNFEKGNLRHLIQKWIDEYHSLPASTDREKLAKIVDLCQKIERLHPFPDGNCRLTGVLLLNHLLIQQKLPLTMLWNPNRLDGYSKEEIIAETIEGQRRVKGWQTHAIEISA